MCGETSTGVTMESSVLGGGGALITSAAFSHCLSLCFSFQKDNEN